MNQLSCQMNHQVSIAINYGPYCKLCRIQQVNHVMEWMGIMSGHSNQSSLVPLKLSDCGVNASPWPGNKINELSLSCDDS